MRWQKIGRIFHAWGQQEWMQTHASVPFAHCLEKNLYRVYFSCRDRQNRSHVGWFTFDITHPTDILEVSTQPALAPGSLGTFDEMGVMGSWLTVMPDHLRMYYIGFTIQQSVPQHTAIGLALSTDGGVTFQRHTLGPVLERNTINPFYVSNPCVLYRPDQWHMWYLSGLPWRQKEVGTRPLSTYHIAHATSPDGIKWQPQPGAAVPLKGTNELAIARPSVIEKDGLFHMWYSYRGLSRSYRIGHAMSPDACTWQRYDDTAGIDVSATGWDSEMIAYPYVFSHQKQLYMLYCGNDFSQGGLGLAILAECELTGCHI